MSTQVSVVFYSNFNQINSDKIPLYDFGYLLAHFLPEVIRLETYKFIEQGYVTRLQVKFKHNETATIFKENIIRLEGELGYNAVWEDIDLHEPIINQNDWLFLKTEVEPIALPSGKPIATIFELSKISEKLFEFSSLNNIDTYLGIEIKRTEPAPEIVKSFIPALAELQTMTNQQTIYHSLQQIIELCKNEGWTSSEYIGIPKSRSDLTNVVEAIVCSEFNNIASFLSLDFLSLNWINSPFASANSTPAQYISNMRPMNYINTIFQRLCSKSQLAQNLDNKWKTNHLRRNIPNEGESDYIFISYARKNQKIVQELFNILAENNINYWFDENMEPGSIWDETLEDRVRNCSMMLACVSDEYQSSKYCRREIKFAELISTPIIPVSFGPWSWSNGIGLQMMFQEYQIYDVRKDGWPKLLNKIIALTSRNMPS